MTLETLSVILSETGQASTNAVPLCIDEIAVNTKMMQELPDRRKVPDLFKIMGGSFAIKMGVIPAALALTAFAPGVIVPLMTFGGIHLACEGLRHLRGEHDEQALTAPPAANTAEKEPAQKLEKQREKSQLRKILTIDGMLSVEITVMTLGIISGLPIVAAGAVLAATGLLRTGWMYSLIGGITNLPRLGRWLDAREGANPVAAAARGIGHALTKVSPHLTKAFAVLGTFALLMVGGGLLLHGIPGAEHALHGALECITANGVAQELLTRAAGIGAGLAAGFVATPGIDRLYSVIGKGARAVKKLFKNRFGKKTPQSAPTPGLTPPPPSLDSGKIMYSTPIKDTFNPRAAGLENPTANGINPVPEAKPAPPPKPL